MKCKDWKVDASRYWETGLQWEAFARNLPGDEWTVEWIAGGCTRWLGFNATLQEFSAAVAEVSTAIGRPPDKTEGKPDRYSTTLAATWEKVEPPHRVFSDRQSGQKGTVTVRCYSRSCKTIEVVERVEVVPPSPFEQRIEIKAMRLHPECAHVVDGLMQ